ncbi:MAG: DNA (cytosine-5-)-methyltransferase [Candidatus Omnitrophota bacterium]
MKLTFIDLFAGIGGFRSALESFGAKCVFSSEWDKYAAKTYKENFGEEPAGDITKIKAENMPKHNILCGGFPCQAFSISGKQHGFSDARGTLFFDVARIADFHKPEVLFLENVKNLVKHDDGKTLKTIYRILDEIGYDVFHDVLNASYFGVPQKRERVYFVCFRKNLKIKNFEFPKPTYTLVSLKDIAEPEAATKDFHLLRDDIKLAKKAISQRMLLNPNPCRPIRVGIINKGGQGERIYSEEGHAITLSAYGGGAAGKTGAYLINGHIRQLTPRECLRVLGFQEAFHFPKGTTTHQAYKQCGNSVVVPVIKKIFGKVQAVLEKSSL